MWFGTFLVNLILQQVMERKLGGGGGGYVQEGKTEATETVHIQR
jgi:hypothetical protein